MSRSSSSTSHQASNTNIVLEDIDGIAVAGDSNNIQVLDGNAIELSYDFATSALDLLNKQNARTLDYGQKTTENALSYTQDIIATNSEKQGDQISNLILYLGLGALVVMGIKYVR